MSAGSENSPEEIFKALRKARLAVITILIIAASILLATGVIFAINDRKEYQAVTLPGVLQGVYTLCWMASPLVGINILWKARHLKRADLTDEQRHLAAQFRLCGAAAILAVVPGAVGFIFVWFATGFTR